MGRHHTDFVTIVFMPPKTPRLSAELLAYYRLISSRPFTVVDVETTGFTPAECRVIEISVIQASLKDGIILQKTSLINPGILIPPESPVLLELPRRWWMGLLLPTKYGMTFKLY